MKGFLPELMPHPFDNRVAYYLLFQCKFNDFPAQCEHRVTRFQYLKHIPYVLALHYLVLHYLYQCQSDGEEGFSSF